MYSGCAAVAEDSKSLAAEETFREVTHDSDGQTNAPGE